MKKLGFVIATLAAIVVAAPSIASAETGVMRHGERDLNGARAEMMHRHHGWHRHRGGMMRRHHHRH